MGEMEPFTAWSVPMSRLRWNGRIEAGQTFYVWAGSWLLPTKEEADRMWVSIFRAFSFFGFWGSGVATALLVYNATFVGEPEWLLLVYCAIAAGAAIALGLEGLWCLNRIGKSYDSPAIQVVKGGRFKATLRYVEPRPMKRTLLGTGE